MTTDVFNPAQMMGYVTFLCSIIAFYQKQDRRLKFWLTGQTLLYASHFFLMGNPAAMVSALLSATRNALSIYTRALWVVLLLLSANALMGFITVKTFWNLLPLLGTAVATLSMFLLQGIRLRLGLFCSTLLWLANDILTGSIGGTTMELMNGLINCITMIRLYRGDISARELLIRKSGVVQAEPVTRIFDHKPPAA